MGEKHVVNEIESKYELSPVMISPWKTEYLDTAIVFKIVQGDTTKFAKNMNQNKRFKEAD
jgi:hypothetical protein